MTRLRSQLFFFAGARTVINTAYRMVYPFLPVLARGLGVDLKAMSAALFLRSASGAVGPLLAPVSDRRGRRFGLTLGLGLFTAGALASFFGPGFAAFTAGLILMTVGKYVFDPSVLAHFGDSVPYERRGTVLALTELSWSLSFVVGVPAAGFLMARFGWRSPFLALACLGFAASMALRLSFPKPAGPPAGSRHLENYRAVLGSPAALMGLLVIFFAGMGNEVVNVVFGVWLENSFGLKLAALGAASAVIGVSEFGGESLVAATVDRVGKTRALMIGLATNAAVALAFPLAAGSVAAALAGLTLFYLTFEYTVVSIIPVMSEILPRSRATLLGFYAASFSLGRAAGSLAAPWLYDAGFRAVTLTAAGLDVLAILALLRLRRLTAGAFQSSCKNI